MPIYMVQKVCICKHINDKICKLSNTKQFNGNVHYTPDFIKQCVHLCVNAVTWGLPVLYFRKGWPQKPYRALNWNELPPWRCTMPQFNNGEQFFHTWYFSNFIKEAYIRLLYYKESYQICACRELISPWPLHLFSSNWKFSYSMMGKGPQMI